MNANVIEVKPFNITKIELVALRGPKGETGYPTPEEIQTAVDAWLEDHPEATTTVQDGAITTAKLHDGAVTEDKLSESLQSLLITDTAIGSIASFSDGSDGINVRDLKVHIEPVQSGSGDPSPSNIRPITGWENVKVTRTGRNIIENQGAATSTNRGVTATKNADGSVTLNGTVTGGTMYYKMAGGYFVSEVPIPKWLYGKQLTLSGGTSEVAVMFSTYDASGTATNHFSTTSPATFTIAEDQKYFGCFLNSSNGSVINNVTVCPQLEVGSSASSYEPYTAAEVTIPLGSTVYGGTLDVTTGGLTVDRAMVDLGTLTWTYNNTSYSFGFFNSSAISSRKVGRLLNALCSRYAVNTGNRSNLLNGQISSFNETNANAVCVRDEAYTDAATFKTAMNGVKLVYELATPTTVQLTPQQLNTLLGVNNIWSDAGDASVEYYADTKLYIDLAGQTEEDMTANANIASGRYFQIGNTLYISTAAIAAGETIVPGTNCRKTTIAEALNALL